jgi:DNA replication protein DnaC
MHAEWVNPCNLFASQNCWDFVAAHATATFNQTIDRLKKIDLLILDDWGLEPFSGRAQNDMLELIESRLATKSLIITSQTQSSCGTI